MGCNCNGTNERFRDIEHVSILAKQCANIDKKDYIVYFNGSYYNFEPAGSTKRPYIRIIQYDRDVTSWTLSNDVEKLGTIPIDKKKKSTKKYSIKEI